GFGAAGATLEDVRLMRENSAPHVQVKASGGIKTLAQLRELRALGASRIGTSSTQAILAEARAELGSRRATARAEVEAHADVRFQVEIEGVGQDVQCRRALQEDLQEARLAKRQIEPHRHARCGGKIPVAQPHAAAGADVPVEVGAG